MLEPENYQESSQPSLLDGDVRLNNFNRFDLRVAGGWSIFLAILGILSLIFSLYGLISTANYSPYSRYGLGASVGVVPTVISLFINLFLIYWYLVFGNASRKMGDVGAAPTEMHKMSAGVLAIFQFWGIMLTIIVVFYFISLFRLMS